MSSKRPPVDAVLCVGYKHGRDVPEHDSSYDLLAADLQGCGYRNVEVVIPDWSYAAWDSWLEDFGSIAMQYATGDTDYILAGNSLGGALTLELGGQLSKLAIMLAKEKEKPIRLPKGLLILSGAPVFEPVYRTLHLNMPKYPKTEFPFMPYPLREDFEGLRIPKINVPAIQWYVGCEEPLTMAKMAQAAEDAGLPVDSIDVPNVGHRALSPQYRKEVRKYAGLLALGQRIPVPNWRDGYRPGGPAAGHMPLAGLWAEELTRMGRRLDLDPNH